MFNYGYKFNTIVVFLLSIIFIWFFFFCKHNSHLSEVNVFNVDPYDAVGSIGIQVSFLAALLSILRLSLSFFTKHLSDSHIVLIIRGNIVALFSINVTMISNIIALIRYNKSWIHSSSGILLAIIVSAMLLFSLFIIIWTMKIAQLQNIRIECRLTSLKNVCIFSGFIILAFYPLIFQKSIIWALFTAFTGMVIQMMIIRNLTFAIMPSKGGPIADLADLIKELISVLKLRLTCIKPLLDKVERNMNKPKPGSFFSWLNPGKHRWNLVIIIVIFSGLSLALLEGFGEGWIGFNMKAFLLFSVFFVGESMIIVLFYAVFGKFLGIMKEEFKYKNIS